MHFWLQMKVFETYMESAVASSRAGLWACCATFVQELTDILSETQLTRTLKCESILHDTAAEPISIQLTNHFFFSWMRHLVAHIHTQSRGEKALCVVLSKSKSRRRYIRQHWSDCECSYTRRDSKSSPIIVAALSNKTAPLASSPAVIFLPYKRTNNFIRFKRLPRVRLFWTAGTAFSRGIDDVLALSPMTVYLKLLPHCLPLLIEQP